MEITRRAAVAGTFYPSDRRALARQIDTLLGAAAAAGDARPPKLIVVPHAGLVYSGPVAAAAYALLAQVATTAVNSRVILIAGSLGSMSISTRGRSLAQSALPDR